MSGNQDITSARETYEGVIRAIKISTPFILLLTAFVIYLLTR
jgi:hypothetical protein